MSAVVHIADYGIGNLYSVARAIEKSGAEARISADRPEIANADRLILPGVGAFKNGMDGLRAAGLDDAVREFARSGRPLMGICLGMQMLATRSLEFGDTPGLDLIPGSVAPIPPMGADGAPHKIPFIGWAELEDVGARGYGGTPLRDMQAEDSVYLVHSYHYAVDDAADLLAVYRYDGVPVTAAVARDNVVGCQFHPEKSGPVGLRIVSRFVGL